MAKDLKTLHSRVAAVRDALPDPDENSQEWLRFILSFPSRWHQLVDMLFYSQSCLDRQQIGQDTAQLSFKCELCNDPQPAFASSKALAQHQRIKHKMRSVLRLRVDDSGVCPCCHNVYHTRYRVLAHLQNPKKPACKDFVLNSGEVPILSAETVRKLDEMDKIAIREARKKGHTHPKVTKPARRVELV